MEIEEIRKVAQAVVTKAKATARVEQGTLKRSIAFTYVGGVIVFRQIYWGAYNDNSLLEDLARKMMPNGVKYRIVLTQMGGKTYTGSTKGISSRGIKTGRVSQKNALSSIISSTTNILNLAKKVLNGRKKSEEE